jgi:NADPH:quinone reductase-like Zn-dependent oxidoreductase
VRAALITDYNHPPRYEEHADPVAAEGEVLVAVEAAALSMLVRSQANGTHYSSHGRFPFVPGVDGVGRLPDGQRVYFAFPRAPFGAMAELAPVKAASCIPLGDGVDPALAAALANPGMSSVAALVHRAKLEAGETVLINGATGASGRLAIQIARRLGAGRIIATGRSAASVAPLAVLGADELLPLDAPDLDARLAALMGGVDIVLDYLWGSSAQHILGAMHGPKRVRFIQIGSVGGDPIAVPAAALRSSGLELLGSGIGSVPMPALLGAIGQALGMLAEAPFIFDHTTRPLTEVHRGWTEDTGPSRLVFTLP